MYDTLRTLLENADNKCEILELRLFLNKKVNWLFIHIEVLDGNSEVVDYLKEIVSDTTELLDLEASYCPLDKHLQHNFCWVITNYF